MSRLQRARAIPILPAVPTRRTVEWKGDELLANVTQEEFDHRMKKGHFGGDPLKCALTPMNAKRKGNPEFGPWMGPEEDRR